MCEFQISGVLNSGVKLFVGMTDGFSLLPCEFVGAAAFAAPIISPALNSDLAALFLKICLFASQILRPFCQARRAEHSQKLQRQK
jgi:hypothetical protein